MQYCDYTRTISGKCSQPPVSAAFRHTPDRTACYYHDRVLAGVIETDEAQSLLDMPVIAARHAARGVNF